MELEIDKILILAGLFFVFISVVSGGLKIPALGETNIEANEKTRIFLRRIGIFISLIGFVLFFNLSSQVKSSKYETVTVNAPISGYLSLKEKPDITSEVLFQIPHSEKINIYDCKETIDKDNFGEIGHWCKCDYRMKKGWVFDRYVKRE